MGEVKRWYPDTCGDGVVMAEANNYRYVTSDEDRFVAESDYARLERERDELDAAASGLCGEVAELTMKLEKADAELARLRAVEADYAALQDFMRDRMPALIAARLAADDGYDPEDQHGGLYDLRWSGGAQPEPMGDAWSMDYLPRGEKIAADLVQACGRKG